MSRNPADVPSSASNPPNEQRQSPRRPHSPHRHTLSSSDPATQPIQGASSSSHIASHQAPSSSSSHVETPAPTAPTSDLESEGQQSGRRPERSSPSASSSQGDMADTEMEAGPSKPTASESAPEGPPPKKKRTRTLTTPHQAAVLHALLAQSRFPTTQMREEVGRSIGLSARKVQIWFQNQRQKARRPRGQAATSAPLTRPPQFGPFTNAPPGTASSEVSPTATTAHSASSAEGFFPRGPGGVELPYGASAPSSAASERFAHTHTHRDPYLAEEYARSSMVPTQLAGPGIPGSSRRPSYAAGSQGMEGGAWRAQVPSGMPGFSSRPSTSGTETAEMYRMTPRPGRPAGEQGPELPLSLPPVITNVPRARAPASSPIGGSYPSLASLSSLEAGPSSIRPGSFDDRGRAFPQPNIDFSTPRAPLNIPPPFTLQPQPQWDDPAFSPYNTRRRSPPELPHAVAPPFGAPSPTAHSPLRGEPLPSISTVVPMPSVRSPSSLRSPRSPTPRARFDPIRSSAGRAPLGHAARPGFHDLTDEPPPPSNR
ncbi:homeobox-domain-containing protein [Trametes cingulata]|nr:homeobox-domain-containing protein [Trametes cingulata]